MKYTVLFTILVLLGACSKTTSTGKGVIGVDLDQQKALSANDLFSRIEVVTLETSEQSLIHTISQVIEHQSRLYILDRRQNEK